MSPDLVSIVDIADRLDVNPHRVAMWQWRDRLPEPIASVTRGRVPVWEWSDIVVWVEEGKTPLGPVKVTWRA